MKLVPRSKNKKFKVRLLPQLIAGLFFSHHEISSADTFVITYEAVNEVNTTSSFTSGGVETFDSRTSNASAIYANYSTTFGTQINASTPLISGLGATIYTAIRPPDRWGGVNYTNSGWSQATTSRLTLDTPVNYLGVYMSSIYSANQVNFYRDSSKAEQLYSFTMSTAQSVLGTCSTSNVYCYNNAGTSTYGFIGELYAFFNFYNTTSTFKYVELVGPGLEYDNLTVGSYTSISGTNTSTLGDIVVATNGSTNSVANLNTLVNPVFDGGTLLGSATATTSTGFTITNNGGTINPYGYGLTFSGVIANASGATGSLTITDTGASAGSVTFSGINTYTGSTTINSGASLKLSGSGSIATSSGLANNGSFDISGTTSGASLKDITGSGTTALGSKTLTLTNPASTTYSGIISGTGGINLYSGTKILSGANTYSGGTEVQAGATLQVASASAIGTGTLALVGNATTTATLKTTGNMTIGNGITVAGDPTFNVSSGTTLTISSPIVDGSSAGDVVVTGGGTLVLSAANTYTGSTTIDSGSTLTLIGSIGNSVGFTNYGNFSIGAAASSINLAGNYTQSSTGNLTMNWYQRMLGAGTASLGGSLTLINTSGTSYSAGRYTLLNATAGRTGTFSSFNTSNLSSSYLYALAYDSNNVYLDLTSIAPSTSSTQQSLRNTVSALQNTFTLQNSVLTNSLSYDCKDFGPKGICLSTGGRRTALSGTNTSNGSDVQANNLNSASGLLIASYKSGSKIRIGAYADQNISSQGTSTVKLGNNTPLLGVFTAWNPNSEYKGFELKISAAYGQKNTTVTRSITGDSEAGTGSSKLISRGAEVMTKYGLLASESTLITPYLGVRYNQNNMASYAESTSSTVTAPLTYSPINTSASTASTGVAMTNSVMPGVTTIISAGVESDITSKAGYYFGTNGNIANLTAVNFNPSPVKTRATATAGAYYDFDKNQRIGVAGIYRQEPFSNVKSTSVTATYSVFI